MAENRNILIQDDQGNNYYPHGKAKTTFFEDSQTLESRAAAWDGKETPAGAQAKANQAEANAKNYVNTSFVKKAIYLPANTDMNNVRDEGEYYNPANAEVSTFANRPDDQSCYVKVSKHAGVNQTWYVFNPSDNRVFTRNFYNNSWGPWKKVLNIDDYNELKHSGVDAKNKIAGAISAKGVPASANEDFATLAAKIGQISTGIRHASGNQGGSSVEIANLDFEPLAVMIEYNGSFYYRDDSGWSGRSARVSGGAYFIKDVRSGGNLSASASTDRGGNVSIEVSTSISWYSNGFEVSARTRSDYESWAGIERWYAIGI